MLQKPRPNHAQGIAAWDIGHAPTAIKRANGVDTNGVATVKENADDEHAKKLHEHSASSNQKEIDSLQIRSYK